MIKKRLLPILAVLGLLSTTLASGANRSFAADDPRTFPETGKTVSGTFLDYWNNHGGLAQQGFPISEEMQEMSDTNGKTYTVQYFERSVFELHPENAAPYGVLLSLLGVSFYADKYEGNAPDQKASTTNPRTFPETGKTIGGAFRIYWEKNGGLAQQGFPISDEFQEVNDTDGKTYTVQYFERAVFELHPENAGKPSEVLLSLLGKFQLDFKSGTPPNQPNPPVPPRSPSRTPTSTPTPSPTLTPAPTATVIDTSIPGLTVKSWTHVVVFTNNVALFYNANTLDVATARVNADGTLTLLRTRGQLVSFSAVTQIVPGPENTVFFYNRAGGACSLATVTDDGDVVPKLVYRPFSPFWDIISLDPATHKMVFYSFDNGTEGVANLNLNNGEVETLVPIPGTLKPTDGRWNIIMPIGNSFWLRYTKSSGVAYSYRYAANGQYAADPSGISLYPFQTSLTWSNIASTPMNGVSYLYFYDKINGKAMTGVIIPDGRFVPIQVYEGLSTEWTHMVAAPNGVVLIYSAETGNIATDKIETTGAVTPLQRYSPNK